ncbi:transketolase [Chromobacterium alkanivorans]|uniref:transketolase n=1 Tax=Chromobacterium TaxID=535 RepID=UPI0006536668|nr:MULTISPECIES: transketolase [Chromobacterium]KMN83213.1 transketolase [Chromobacterium sp. LK11]MBN3004848.1 transketolase [Chromobacterium alkanivorans]MCS3803146.1 transketolase [Chromobacterium alkanivorans]MCS3817744.1 transketolase [Chromobacterium alkanivorans]MCS3872512.1 transketolase [Chromobacterium alkanivorans]
MVTRTELANAIRFLSMDAVEKAKSGHPGAPMGMADIAEVLWRDHLKHNPANPNWPDRDRFVLSNGHGSMLIYSLLHLSGYDLSIEDLKQFRQLHSKTPGHPEYGYAPGIETTTGPLGQGITNAVGMALAEKMLATQFNRDGHQIVDHHTYAFLGDGCLMEGISHEACSLAGTWGLNKLIAFWDDNGISIDGHVEGWFTDDTPARFEAYGWQVIKNVNGHDPVEVATAIATAQKESARPTLICCKTTIGFGAPTKQGSHDCHGAPLGAAEIAAAREGLNWPHAPFEIPAEIYAAWSARDKGALAEIDWNKRFDAYRAAYPELAAEFSRRMQGELPAGWEEAKAAALAKIADAAQTVATRKASQIALEALSPALPEFVGGSADLTGSNLTNWSGSKWIDREGQGNYISYGVREFGMAAIMNGMTLHGGLRPYGGTFLMFSEYARNALRMASLMKINPIFVFTHDSIGLGEDGPTHQPVEQVATLRYIPNHNTWRPCDTAETAAAWAHAVEQKTTPSSMVLSRQNLPFVVRDAEQLAAIQKGGYVLRDAAGARAVLIATGSEVELALKAQEALAAEGVAVRVVSMPCTNVFDRQDKAWRDSVLPAGLPRLAIEAGHPDFWRKYVGLDGDVVGIDHFGESAPAPQLFQAFGFTVDNVVARTKALL